MKSLWRIYTDGKWIVYLQKGSLQSFFLFLCVIGRGNYVQEDWLYRESQNIEGALLQLIKPEIAIFFPETRERARFSILFPSKRWIRRDEAKFDAERVIYGASFSRNYAHKDALKSNQFLRTQKNMRLHESQNFHFHNVHNNVDWWEARSRENSRVLPAFTCALQASIIKLFEWNPFAINW